MNNAPGLPARTGIPARIGATARTDEDCLAEGETMALGHPATADRKGGQQVNTLRAYKRSPALSNSTWYKGMLVSQMAGTADNEGAFDFAIAGWRPGTEPPPHVHEREHEFFYLLSGEIRVYVDGEVFSVTAGECMFLPVRKPHAFLVTSKEVRVILLTTPGGFLDAINRMNAPAERMELPAEADTVTYATEDLTETFKVFAERGIRFLTADEIRAEMPQYPLQ
jgi:mannose-6-phosphate isomerase-like protein (cupin superfamily)